jgi:hypothetical protein
MMTTNKIPAFTTETHDVVWAHLHAPDDKFGADSANHNITVLVDAQLQKKLDGLLEESGATKINGMRETDEGDTLLKVKSKTFVKKGVTMFPCRDASSNKTSVIPFGGDKVRLRVAPAVLTRDNSMSLYLNGCQIIEKNNMGGGDAGGFDATEGFVDNSTPTVESDDTDLPI